MKSSSDLLGPRPPVGMTVCSGIGAPEVSAPWVDWRYQSEIDKFPSAVLAHRFPDATNLGDMTKFEEWPDAEIDILCGGTPCQSFSVAGLRRGLADDRGNLMLTYCAIAARYHPRWLVWENVPGVLSSNRGRDFGTLLGALGQLGYGVSYRVLDAQHVRTRRFARAVPQRRRRVFVVGYLGDWRRAAAVLFDGESLRGNPPPRRKSREDAAGISGQSVARGGREVAASLDASFGRLQGASGQDLGHGHSHLVSTAPVASALRAEGHDASEDETGRQNLVVAIQERAISENPASGPDGAGVRLDGATYTLEARTTPQAVAFSCKDYGADATEQVSPTMRAMGHAGSHANAGGQMAVAFDPNQITSKTNRSQPTPELLHTMPATAAPPHLVAPTHVRRLTPTECERLMAFPDGWTDIPYRNKRAADGPRYKALGNSWAVNCGEWVFDRLREIDKIPHTQLENADALC